MSPKNKILDIINKKAQRIKERKAEIKNNSQIELFAFEFFRNIDDARKAGGNNTYQTSLLMSAFKAFKQKARTLDKDCKISINWSLASDDILDDAESVVESVNVHWSIDYINLHKDEINPRVIGVTDMLFL